MRYTHEQKTAALKSIEEVGVAKTAEAMQIAIQTLYKWRNESSATKPPEKTAVKARASDVRAELANDRTLQKKIDQLEAENKDLRATVVRQRAMLRAAIGEE